MKIPEARRWALAVAVMLLVAACSSGEAAPTTTLPTTSTSTTSTTSTTTTTTTTTSSTIPVAPETVPLVPSTTKPVEKPRPKNATGPCESSDGTVYCVWGNKPMDRTVNNSRIAQFNLSIDQVFTATDEYVSAATVEITSLTIGTLTEATDQTTNDQVCVRVTLGAEGGLPAASIGYTVKSTRGATQQLEVPLESVLIPNERYVLSIVRGPACAARDIATFVAMSSKWKYPKSSGSLTLDGRVSIGSLWARLD
ncbi:MAG: hypothetical protein FJW53_03640 [Actinobacteria bacterium]|nr:hypothetical protein [Actinomycetota bacterium]